MVGALANGFSQIGDADTIAYYDQKQYWPFWRSGGRTRRPVLSAPAQSACRNTDKILRRAQLAARARPGPLRPETAVHALRLIGCGLVRRVSKVENHARPHRRGHSLLACGASIIQRLDETPHKYPAKHKVGALLPKQFPHHHIWQLSTRPPSLNAMTVIGADRMMFSVDWPFENVDQAAKWFDNADHQRERPRLKSAATNAIKLFKLPLR